MVLEEEEITDEKLLSTIHTLYEKRDDFTNAMKQSNSIDSITKIITLIEDCVKH